MSDRVTPPFAGALADRVLVADGATGTVLRSADLTLDDFAGHEGRHETPNVTGPTSSGRFAATTSKRARTP